MENLFDYLNAEEAEELREKRRTLGKAEEEVRYLVERKIACDLALSAATNKARPNDALAAARFLGEAQGETKAPEDAALEMLSLDGLRSALRGLQVRHQEAEGQLKWAEGELRRAFMALIPKAMDRVGAKYAEAAEAVLEHWKTLDALDSILTEVGGPGRGILPTGQWRHLLIPGARRIPSVAAKTEATRWAPAYEDPPFAKIAVDYAGARNIVERFAAEARQTVGGWPFGRGGR
jgi:hypothetical protein